jgi:hypothetical protein
LPLDHNETHLYKQRDERAPAKSASLRVALLKL